MKRILLPFLLLSVGAFASDVAIVGNRVNLRAAAVGDSEVVGQVSEGETLPLHGALSDAWVGVGVPARLNLWIYSPLLSGDRVNVDKAHVRAGAGLNYHAVGMLRKGDRVEIRGKAGDWTKIAPPAVATVYVTNAFVKAVAPKPVPAPKPVAKPAEPAPVPAAATVAAPPAKPVPTAEPAAAKPLRDRENPRAPESAIASRGTTVVNEAGEKHRHAIFEEKGSAAPVGPAAIPANRLRSDKRQASDGAYFGTLAQTPVFGSHPTKYRLVAFDGNNKAQTVCYVYGNAQQLASLRGESMTVSGAVYWFLGCDLPVVYAQDILRGAK